MYQGYISVLTFCILAKMLDTTLLDTGVLEAVATSASVQATVFLLLISFALQWYMNQPPRPKFPEAELDEKEWHGSLMKAKQKYVIR